MAIFIIMLFARLMSNCEVPTEQNVHFLHFNAFKIRIQSFLTQENLQEDCLFLLWQ